MKPERNNPQHIARLVQTFLMLQVASKAMAESDANLETAMAKFDNRCTVKFAAHMYYGKTKIGGFGEMETDHNRSNYHIARINPKCERKVHFNGETIINSLN